MSVSRHYEMLLSEGIGSHEIKLVFTPDDLEKTLFVETFVNSKDNGWGRASHFTLTQDEVYELGELLEEISNVL